LLDRITYFNDLKQAVEQEAEEQRKREELVKNASPYTSRR
jgi:hypothetical protein